MLKLFPTGDLLDLAFTLRRFQAWGDDAANCYDGVVFKKVFFCKDRHYLLTINEQNGSAVLNVLPKTKSKVVWAEAEKIARHILGLSFPLEKFYHFAASDPVLNKLTREFRGLRPTLTADPFEMMVTSITAQQINLRFAFTTRTRLIQRFGEKLEIDGKNYYAFPTPARLARVKIDTLRKMQFSERKAEYIIDLARAIENGVLEFDGIENLSDDEIADKLLPLRGIGRWSVDWFLARGLGRGHAIATGDLGVRKAIQHFYFEGENKTEEELRDLAKRWGEFTNLAVHYLLMGLMLGT